MAAAPLTPAHGVGGAPRPAGEQISSVTAVNSGLMGSPGHGSGGRVGQGHPAGTGRDLLAFPC
jgi:hypothetical protein